MVGLGRGGGGHPIRGGFLRRKALAVVRTAKGWPSGAGTEKRTKGHLIVVLGWGKLYFNELNLLNVFIKQPFRFIVYFI